MLDAIMSLFGTLLYPLFSIFFLLIDGIQALFKAFAGTGTIMYGGATWGNAETVYGDLNYYGPDKEGDFGGGIVYYLFQSDLVKNLFMSILILALFLIIIFTVMAFIKNAYSAKQKKWQEIIGNAFIGLANFIFIPVCCLLGVLLGNILLNAIDGATNISGASSMSKQLFLSAAYSANEFRGNTGDVANFTTSQEAYDAVVGFKNYWLEKNSDNKEAYDEIASIEITLQAEWSSDTQKEEVWSYYAERIDAIYGCEGVNVYWYWEVEDWYSLWNINYFILAGGGGFILYALGAISFGMIKRMFTLLMLFVISPALCALYPLDDGKAVGQWKGDFIKNTISAYGAVAGMNLFFSLAPIIQNIKLKSSGWVGSTMDALGLTSLLLTIAGLFVAKDFISMISGYVGGGNAFADGSSLMSSVNKKTGLGGLGKGGIKAFGKAAGAFGSTKGVGGKVKAFGGSLLKSAGDGGLSLLKSTTGIDFTKEGRSSFVDAMKSGESDAKTASAKKRYISLLNSYTIASDDQEKEAYMRQMVEIIERNGLGDKYMEKAAKSRGLSVEQLKEEIENGKQQKAKQKALDYAQANQDNMKAFFDALLGNGNMAQVREQFEQRFGKKLEDFAEHLFGDRSDRSQKLALRSLAGGRTFTDDMIANMQRSASTQERKLEIASQAQSFNAIAGQVNGLSEAVVTARTALADFYESLNGKVYTYSGDGKHRDLQPIRLSEADMAQMRSEIVSGMEVTNNALIDAIRDNSKNSKATYEELIRQAKKVLSDWDSANKGKK